MEDQLQDKDYAQVGDKVRIRSGEHAGERGIVKASVDEALKIQLDGGDLLQFLPKEITNYSLAARRAWRVMPKRAGRPQIPTPRKKMVSMRIDIEVWDMLQEAAERGLISNREQAVNNWIREQVFLLLAKNE